MSETAKRQVQNRRKLKQLSYIWLTVCILIIGGFLYTLAAQQLRLIEIRRETKRCQEEIALQEKEYERLEKKAEYSSSDKFYEEKARDEGYIREDETLFVVGN